MKGLEPPRYTLEKEESAVRHQRLGGGLENETELEEEEEEEEAKEEAEAAVFEVVALGTGI